MYEDSTAGHPHTSEEDILALLCQSKAYPSDTPAENALLKEVGTDIHNDGSLISLDVVTGLGHLLAEHLRIRSMSTLTSANDVYRIKIPGTTCHNDVIAFASQ